MTTTTSPPGRRIRWPGGSPADSALVAVLAGSSVVGVASEMAASPNLYPNAAGGYALAVASALPLLVRRHHPVVATALTSLAVLAYHLLGYPGLAPALCLFVAVYSTGAYGKTSWSWLYGLGGLAAAHITPVLPPHGIPWESYAVTGPVAGMAALLVVGVAARVRRLDAEGRVRTAAVTAQAQLRQRMAEERLGIARELHDVLAHTISVIVVQSGVALDALDSDLETSRTAMRSVRAVARRAMPDLRGALALLRAESEPAAPGEARLTDPDAGDPQDPGLYTGTGLLAQPGLPDLDDLIDGTRGTGLTVTLDRVGDTGDVSPLVALAAYRIVQEALTNVVRHAHATGARVTVTRDGPDLVVEIVDDGRVPLPGAGTVTGLGLLGMRERAALVGGTVAITARPDAGHGVLVHARLPIGAPTA